LADTPHRTEWPAAYLDGRTAARRTATIWLQPGGIEVSVQDGERFRWPYREIRQTQGFHARDPVRLQRGDGVGPSLVVADSAILTHLRDVAGADGARFRRGGAGWTGKALAAALGAIAVALLLYLWGIPLAARAMAPFVPVAWEDRMGATVVRQLAPPSKHCRGAAGQRALETLLARIVAAGPSPYRFRVVVLDDPTLNAFAAPGGHVVVLRGLIERARTPDELAGVLAHEAQHVLRRHGTRALIERASTGLLVAALIGDVSGFAAFAAETVSALTYSRQHEDEADVEGMRLLAAAGIDQRGLIGFFEHAMAEEARLPKAVAYLSTHPHPADRLARLRGLVTATATPLPPAMPAEEWAALRAICR
jgi:Zn-dependent protease with chaperone function